MMTDNERNYLFRCAAGAVGLAPVSEEAYSPSLVGLQDYFDDLYGSRDSYFSAEEFVTPLYPKLVQGDAKILLPPQRYWPRLALLRWIADQCRFDEPVRTAHVWRPRYYNKAVGSWSDNHVECCAIDLDFSSAYSLRNALEHVLQKIWRSPVNFGMGLGIGARRIHVDCYAPAWERVGFKRRYWKYASAK